MIGCFSLARETFDIEFARKKLLSEGIILQSDINKVSKK